MQYSEPEYAKSSRKKTDYPWYRENIDKYLLPEVRAILTPLTASRL
jgi:hypothetical protein